MKYRASPNGWSCLITCASMVLEKEIVELTQMLGHDGSEQIPGPKGPSRRGFSVEEIMYLFMKFRVPAWSFNKQLLHYYSAQPIGQDCWCKYTVLQTFPNWSEIIQEKRKIVMNEKHSWVEWDGQQFDPAYKNPFPNKIVQGVIVIGDHLPSSPEVHT